MFLDTIRLLVRNENWPKANLHVTKENKSFKKNNRQSIPNMIGAVLNRLVGMGLYIRDLLVTKTCNIIIY